VLRLDDSLLAKPTTTCKILDYHVMYIIFMYRK